MHPSVFLWLRKATLRELTWACHKTALTSAVRDGIARYLAMIRAIALPFVALTWVGNHGRVAGLATTATLIYIF